MEKRKMHSEFYWEISWEAKICKDIEGDEEYKMSLKNIAYEHRFIYTELH
jgi:hypothetical protein